MENAAHGDVRLSKRITLFLMTEKGYEFLRETFKHYSSMFGMVVVGRDVALKNDYAQEIIDFCDRNRIRWINKEDAKEVETEYALAISWRWLIKHPAQKLIVFHDSVLPKYRGFSPLVNALINGENEIGVSAIFAADEFDTGDILAQSKSTVTYPMKIADAINLINNDYFVCAHIVLTALRDGVALRPTKQDESQASYSVWRDEHDYQIDWGRSADQIHRLINAVGYPYRGASTLMDGKIVRVLAADIVPDVRIENRDHGKVLFLFAGQPVVICGQGLLKITEAQVELDGNMLPFFPIPRFRIRFT